MSETVEHADPVTAPEPAPSPPPAPDAEAWARRLGWAPQEEWRGDKEHWIDAPKFLERTLGNPAIVTERLGRLDNTIQRLEREQRESKQRFAEATGTITHMTEMLRSSEERAYKRARDELKAERDRAVESGDVAAYRRADAQMDELDRGRQPQPVQPQTNGQQPPPAQTPGQMDPAVQAFYARNQWYTRDPELTSLAEDLHFGLMRRNPTQPLAENLAEVERQVRALRPERFEQRTPQPRGDNPRREEPSSVSPSSGTGVPRRETGRRDFASLPQESKTAFDRYKRMMTGKGEALTEKEWAEYYYEQPDT